MCQSIFGLRALRVQALDVWQENRKKSTVLDHLKGIFSLQNEVTTCISWRATVVKPKPFRVTRAPNSAGAEKKKTSAHTGGQQPAWVVHNQTVDGSMLDQRILVFWHSGYHFLVGYFWIFDNFCILPICWPLFFLSFRLRFFEQGKTIELRPRPMRLLHDGWEPHDGLSIFFEIWSWEFSGARPPQIPVTSPWIPVTYIIQGGMTGIGGDTLRFPWYMTLVFFLLFFGQWLPTCHWGRSEWQQRNLQPRKVTPHRGFCTSSSWGKHR